MAEITTDQTFNYTVGGLMIKIRTDRDQGGIGAEYTIVEFRTDEGEEIKPELCFHTDDMRIVAEAGINHVLNAVPIDNQWHCVQFNTKRPGDEIKDVSVVTLMTGQEWYDQFEKEIHSWTQGAYSGDTKSVIAAAQKASGLS